MSDYSWLLQIGFIVLFFFGPILFGIILPLLVAFLISRWLFAKSIPIKHFRWFFLTIVILTFTANIIWKIFISNHIYYEWDTILITPFTLLFHEAPVLDGMGTWIAEGWTLFKLDLLYYFMLGLLYVCSVIFLLIDPFSKFSKMQEKRSQFLKATIATTVLLFLFALIFPLIQPTLNNAISNFFPHIKPVERVENKTACTKPIQRNKVYFGGSDADYISADYKTFQKIWDKPGNSGFPSGVPSPDGSMIANPEFDGIWIKCTETDGLYKITMDQKKISGLDVSPQDLAGNISWSPMPQ